MTARGSSRGIIIGVAAALLIGGGLVVWISQSESTPDDAAAPAGTMGAGMMSADIRAEVWTRLALVKDTYLSEWDRAFRSSKPEARTVVKAFHRVMQQVTGPEGFWRDQVPNELLECHTDPSNAVCEGLERAAEDFGEWEDMERDLDRLDSSRADIWLQRNEEAVKRYLDTYVPSARTADAMIQTSFYTQRVKSYVAEAKQ